MKKTRAVKSRATVPLSSNPADIEKYFWDIGYRNGLRRWISELFRYRNDSFQYDIFSSDNGITDVDVGYRISPTLRSMSMPTYVVLLKQSI
jgi:hypothetical protein